MKKIFTLALMALTSMSMMAQVSLSSLAGTYVADCDYTDDSYVAVPAQIDITIDYIDDNLVINELGNSTYKFKELGVVVTLNEEGNLEIKPVNNEDYELMTAKCFGCWSWDTYSYSNVTIAINDDNSLSFLTDCSCVFSDYMSGENHDFTITKGATIRKDSDVTEINAIRQSDNLQSSYNLQGARVNDSYKGIIIRGGRKYNK